MDAGGSQRREVPVLLTRAGVHVGLIAGSRGELRPSSSGSPAMVPAACVDPDSHPVRLQHDMSETITRLARRGRRTVGLRTGLVDVHRSTSACPSTDIIISLHGRHRERMLHSGPKRSFSPRTADMWWGHEMTS